MTAEAGITTFFGDLGEGPAQGDISNNLAYKIMVNRNVKSVIDISGRVSIGNISGEKKRGSGSNLNYQYFHTEFFEYTFDLGINLLALVSQAHKGRFGLYATVGVGLIDFKVKLYDGVNDSIIQTYGYGDQKSTTEFVLPFGGRFIYHASPSFAVSMQTTLSRVDTDKLDGKTGNDNSDFYNYFSLGVTYKFLSDKGRRRRPGGNIRINSGRTRYR